MSANCQLLALGPCEKASLRSEFVLIDSRQFVAKKVLVLAGCSRIAECSQPTKMRSVSMSQCKDFGSCWHFPKTVRHPWQLASKKTSPDIVVFRVSYR